MEQKFSRLIIRTARAVSLSLYDRVMAHVQTKGNKTFYYRFTCHREDTDEHSLDILFTTKKYLYKKVNFKQKVSYCKHNLNYIYSE